MRWNLNAFLPVTGKRRDIMQNANNVESCNRRRNLSRSRKPGTPRLSGRYNECKHSTPAGSNLGWGFSIPETMNTIIILHDSKDDPFSRVPKTLLDDPNLTLAAKGLLAYLLGKPKDWKLRISDIEKKNRNKERAIRSALRNLQNFGYARYDRPKVIGGCGVWYISDSPMFSRRCSFSNGCNSNVQNVGSTKIDSTKIDITKIESKESEEDTRSACAVIEPVFKPDTRSKSDMLATLPNSDSFPSQEEFSDFLSEQCPMMFNYRPDLYMQLCLNKWRNWSEASHRWQPISDWQAYTKALYTKIMREE